MKLLMFSTGGAPRPGAFDGDRVVDLSEMLAAIADPRSPLDLRTLLALGGGLDAAKRAVAAAGADGAPVHRLASVTLEAPLTRPEKIIGIGLNYADHCREMGRPEPTAVSSFAMFANAVLGPGRPIPLPASSSKMDYEAELVAVIGRRCRHVTEAEALSAVAGYTVGNDVSARDHQAADPAVMRGKFGDGHAPIGPWIVTADELGDPQRLDISLSINGVRLQSSNTREMVFPVAHLVSYLSGFVTLEPGDLIFTGTPHGVGAGRTPPRWLQPGDRIEVTIEAIGTLVNTCAAETA